MLSLAAEFGLELLDSSTDPLASTYYFGRRYYSDSQLLAELNPLVVRFSRDLSSVPANVSYLHYNPQALRLDRMSLKQYLQEVGAGGAVYQLLKSAYVGEEGLDLSRQSALGFCSSSAAPVRPGSLNLFGESDQIYKVRGGSQQIVQALTDRVADRIEKGEAPGAHQEPRHGLRPGLRDARRPDPRRGRRHRDPGSAVLNLAACEAGRAPAPRQEAGDRDDVIRDQQ